MLRQFNQRDLEQHKKLFQSYSDVFVRSVSSATTQQSTPAPTEMYARSFLSDLSKLSSELVDDTVAEAGAGAGVEEDDKDDEAEFSKEFDTKNEKDENLLAMIFKILPIGINIAKKGKTIATGFKEASTGIVNLMTNISLLTVITGLHTITFFTELFIYLFKLIICSVTMIQKFPKCIVFYLIEVLMFIAIVLVISPLFVIDIIFMVKHFIGISCVESFLLFLSILEDIDKMIYSFFSVHIIHYPESIINRCYKCDAMGDTTSFKNAFRNLFGDIFIDIPNGVATPAGKIITGIGHIFSFLNLK
jgi:hypothetical protein